MSGGNVVKGAQFSLWKLFSELISSNIDADRMDYLLRDAHNTGVKLGAFDLQKLIAAMELTEYEGVSKIAIRADALAAVEQFILGRYNMYTSVYYMPYKLLTEHLLSKICQRINEEPYERSENLFRLFEGNADLATYLSMDDYSFLNEIKNYSCKKKDSILEKMLESFLYRRGYERLRLAFTGEEDLNVLLQNEGWLYGEMRYGLMTIKQYYYAYKTGAEEILLVQNNGVVRPLSEVSKLCHIDSGRSQDKLWPTKSTFYYINKQILLEEITERGIQDKEFQIQMLVDILRKYDIQKHIEIENKYYCTKNEIDMASERSFYEDSYFSDFKLGDFRGPSRQTDMYFDTDDFLLAKNNFSLRCRKKGNKFIFTIKKPTVGVKSEQFARLEFETEGKTSQLCEAQTLFNEYLAMDLAKIAKRKITLAEFKKKIEIANNRTSIIVFDNDDDSNFKCELSLDRMQYNYKDGIFEDYQIEIELKSSPFYRVRMNEFAVKLCRKLGIDKEESVKSSKYLKAYALINGGE